MHTQNGRTPLFAASISGFVDVVKILLERVSKLPQRIQRRVLNHTMMVRVLYENTAGWGQIRGGGEGVLGNPPPLLQVVRHKLDSRTS